MNQMNAKQWIGAALFSISIAIFVVGQIATRIVNPDLTETRLFINYWWIWLCAFVVAFIGMSIMAREET